jgi:hypothetical protein
MRDMPSTLLTRTAQIKPAVMAAHPMPQAEAPCLLFAPFRRRLDATSTVLQ